MRYALLAVMVFNFSFSSTWAMKSNEESAGTSAVVQQPGPVAVSSPAEDTGITARLVRLPASFEFNRKGSSFQSTYLAKITRDAIDRLDGNQQRDSNAGYDLIKLEQTAAREGTLTLTMRCHKTNAVWIDEHSFDMRTATFPWASEVITPTKISYFHTILQNGKALFCPYFRKVSGEQGMPSSFLLRMDNAERSESGLFLHIAPRVDQSVSVQPAVLIDNLANVDVVRITCGDQNYDFLQRPLPRQLGGCCCGLQSQSLTLPGDEGKPYAAVRSSGEASEHAPLLGNDGLIAEVDINLFQILKSTHTDINLLFEKESSCTIL